MEPDGPAVGSAGHVFSCTRIADHDDARWCVDAVHASGALPDLLRQLSTKVAPARSSNPGA